ncbi:MAG: hypothetical protein II394_04865, partial [Bacteroidales bacterium]|nr:hypothetical protein [Bacteroidales bacterium]
MPRKKIFLKNFSINKAYLLGYYSLKPRRLLLFLSPKTVNKKSVSAASASLKIVFGMLKRINLIPPCSIFEQNAFLRPPLPIFLTLTSQGGNQDILRSASYLFK